MKILLLFVLYIICLASLAQTDTLHIRYFTNSKKVSTVITIENQRDGKAKAFNKEGKLIYEKHVRRYAGSAMVTFTHYESGAVKKAVYSSAPDAGIQWYKTYTDFSEDGKITNEIEDSHDQRTNLISPIHTLPKDVTTPKKQEDKKVEVAVCAAIHQNNVEVINHTAYQITVTFNHQGKGTVLELKSGEKADGPSYISGQISSPLKDNVTYHYTVNKKNKKVSELINQQSTEEFKTTHTIHFFESVR